jgi:hypothetical protein
MRQSLNEYSGFGELLCLVLAWTVGIVAVWADASGHSLKAGGNKIADGGRDRQSSAYVD